MKVDPSENKIRVKYQKTKLTFIWMFFPNMERYAGSFIWYLYFILERGIVGMSEGMEQRMF